MGGLKDGDVFISINGKDCEGLKHVEAQQLVKNAGSELALVIERGEAVKSLPASFVKVAPPPAVVSPKPTPAPKPPVARPILRPKPSNPAPEEKKEAKRASWYKQLMKTLKDQDEESDVYIPPTASMAQEESTKPSPSQPQQASVRRPPQVVQAKFERPPPKREPALVVKPTPPPQHKEPVSNVKPPPPPRKMEQPPPKQETPTDTSPSQPPPPDVEQPPQQKPSTETAPTPPSEVEQPLPDEEPPSVVQPNPSPSVDAAVTADAFQRKEPKEVSPVVQEVEAEYRESLEKKQQEETKIDELERQIAMDLLSLQETVQQAGVQSEGVNDSPGPPASEQSPVTTGEEVKVQGSPKLHPIQSEPQRAAAVVVNPAVEEDKLERFHPLIVEEMNKGAVKEASPGRLEGDFSALEDLTAPGRHLPADATFKTHKEPEPEPEPEPVVVKKARKPPPAEKARAIFDFKPSNERELAFSTGDVITLTRTVDDNWLEGELDGRSGIVPANYVELCTDDAELGAVPPPSEFADNPPSMKALYNFVPGNERELAFEEGDVISLTRVIDDNWFEGILNGKRGIVPGSFVEVLVPLPGMVIQPPEEVTPEEVPADLPPPQLEEEVTATEEPAQDSGTTQEVIDGGEGGRTLTVEELQDALADMKGEPHEVIFEYTATTVDEIDIVEGDVILVYEKCEDGWYLGVNERTQQFGTFPGNYVRAVM